jgi:uncharacterized protein (TIGR00266 family)
METIISGDMLPVVTWKLNAGETVLAENGGMAWMSNNMKMETTTNGGIMKGLGRALAGESLFMNKYTAETDGQEISFASSFPGQILQFDLQEGQSIIAQKSAFLCASASANIEMHFRKKLGAGFFGGEGFIMQKISGPGRAFLEIDGSVVMKELQAGETLKVDNGYVAAMTSGVNLDITTVQGIKNIFFGGEGLFLTTVTGPGKVWLQSMPLAKLSQLFVTPSSR